MPCQEKRNLRKLRKRKTPLFVERRDAVLIQKSAVKRPKTPFLVYPGCSYE